MRSPAVVLLSGGLDSATTAAIARSEGFALYALTVDYGQRHRLELDAARRVAEALGVARHVFLSIDLRPFGHSALTDAIDVPKDRAPPAPGGEIPSTYVPARNTIFLSAALAFAETIPAADIFIGATAVDYSGYPDCRPEFLAAFEHLANLATKAGVERRVQFRVRAPLLHLGKAEIIRRGVALGLDYALTWSCYDPRASGRPCGECEACRLRQKGFREAGLVDPVESPAVVAAAQREQPAT